MKSNNNSSALSRRLELLEKNALVQFDAGNFIQAKKLFSKLITLAPTNVSAHFHMALILLRDNRLEQALKHGKKTTRLSPQEPNAYLNIGAIYEELGSSNAAIRNYKRELRQQPFCKEALFNLGVIFFEKHQWKRASCYFEQCIKLNHSIETVISMLGYCYQKMRRLQSEIRAYEEFDKRKPNDPIVLQNLGAALLDAGEYQKALMILARAQRHGGGGPFLETSLAHAKSAFKKQL